MKKILTSLTFLLLATAVFAQQLPVDFESTTITYTFNDFAGGAASVIDNPQSSGINTSSKVGQMVKSAGEVYGGSVLVLDGPIDFGDNNAIKMKVLANRVGASVLLKLEGPGGATTGDLFATTTVADQWEEVTYSLAGLTSVEYNSIVLIYELGTVGDGSPDFTFWFDDIELTTAAEGVQLPIDFESTTLNYAWSDFAGGVASVIDNPQSSGINTSAKVGQMVKSAGEVFGGSTLALGGAIDFGANNGLKMKVFANRTGAPVLLKLEGPGAPAEISASTTVANQWEELSFNFSGLTGGVFNKITLIYDLGVVGDGGPDFTLLFDDIELTTVVGGVQLPVTFESTTLDYVWSDFGGGVATIIDNPDPTGINTSAKVGQMVKNAGEVFGGSKLTLGGPIDFGTSTAINMKVWANRVGANVLLKLEGPSGATGDIIVPTTVANAWEELTFDVTGFTGNVYNAVTLIYELGAVGDGGPDYTFYFDDIKLEGTSGTVDFKELGISYFPNPVTDFLTVHAPENIDEIRVFNLLGQQLLFERPEYSQSQLDLSALKPGAYFVKVAMGGKEGTARIIVQ
ncbi:MAG TPA: T9SS type A sorting domain-containing protein [Saprospiraceae bacterium]|nr:T9SS type A sorting domain-containing protein [Saprospiraceae bacterium]